jgi:hypothetical protein
MPVTPAGLEGLIDAAEVIARQVITGSRVSRVLIDTAIAASRTGDPVRFRQLTSDAKAVAQAIPDDEDVDWALSDLAISAAKAGELDVGEGIVGEIGYPHPKAHAYAALAIAAADSGDAYRGRTIANRIPEHMGQGTALAEVAVAVARAGDFEAAEYVAGIISSSSDQASALAGVACRAAQVGEIDRANRFLISLLISELSLTDWIKAVAQLEPSVIWVAWDVLLHRYSSQA